MASLKDRLIRLLRWSEKYTKTDMVYLAKGGFWSVFAQVITALLVFGFAILVAHVLPKDVYGEYKYVIATVSLLSAFSLTGLGTAVFQSVASGFDGALFEGFWANIRWSILVFLGALGLAVYYFLQGNATLAIGMLIGGSLSPFLTSLNLSGAFLSAKKDFARSNIYFSIFENIIAIGALAVTVLLTQNVLILVSVYFASNVLATYFIYRRVVRLYRPDPTVTDRSMMLYAKHLSLMGVLGGIANNIDQILVFHFVGPVELAIYNFAIAIPDQFKGPLKSLDAMMQAQFSGRTDREISVGMSNKMLWMLLVSAMGIVLYILLAPFIFKILFPKYLDSVLYSQLYALAYLANSLNPASSYLAIRKKVREQYAGTITDATIKIITMLIGVMTGGLLGLIIARVVTRFGYMLFNYGLYRRSITQSA